MRLEADHRGPGACAHTIDDENRGNVHPCGRNSAGDSRHLAAGCPIKTADGSRCGRIRATQRVNNIGSGFHVAAQRHRRHILRR